jgi:hypothetical protein
VADQEVTIRIYEDGLLHLEAQTPISQRLMNQTLRFEVRHNHTASPPEPKKERGCGVTLELKCTEFEIGFVTILTANLGQFYLLRLERTL